MPRVSPNRPPTFSRRRPRSGGVELSALLGEAREKFDAMRSFGGGRNGGGNPYSTGLEQAESSLLTMLGDEQT